MKDGTITIQGDGNIEWIKPLASHVIMAKIEKKKLVLVRL